MAAKHIYIEQNLKRVLAIDPGTEHLAAAVFEVSDTTPSKLIDSMMCRFDTDIQTAPFALARLACKIVDFAGQHCVTMTVIEDQQIGGKTNSWNLYAQAALSSAMIAVYPGMPLQTVRPAKVKRFFNLDTGNYRTNKAQALKRAKEIDPCISNDHFADCLLLSEYVRVTTLFVPEYIRVTKPQ
jgi:Holliday junction resolvasome RuvABC endonuclease subunit